MKIAMTTILASLLGVLLGVCGLGASAAIYLVPARPAWNSPHTVAEFLLSAAILGPLFLTAIEYAIRRAASMWRACSACDAA